MRIEAPGENKIVVELTTQDMSDLDITYEDMDYSNIETRRVIWTLLDRAGQALGRDIDPTGRMMIEAIPRKNGGCVMHFTILREEKCRQQIPARPVLRKEETVYTYEFTSLDDLMDCAASFLRMRFTPISSALYASDGIFRLVLGMQYSGGQMRAFFGEYGKLSGTGECSAAATREYWKPICKSDALEKLGFPGLRA